MRVSQIKAGETYVTKHGRTVCVLEVGNWTTRKAGACWMPFRLGGKLHLVAAKHPVTGEWGPGALRSADIQALAADYEAEEARLNAAREEYEAAVRRVHERAHARASILERSGLSCSVYGAGAKARHINVSLMADASNDRRVDCLALFLIELQYEIDEMHGWDKTAKMFRSAARKAVQIAKNEAVDPERCEYVG